MSDVKLAVMQPYFFPYLGYFQLIEESDLFVFYDDVNFITQGWINRNRILINGSAAYVTIPCKNASQNRLICETDHALEGKTREKLIRKFEHSYKNAPYFESVFPIIKNVIHLDNPGISELAIASISKTMNYLEMSRSAKVSSSAYENQQLKGDDRILDICKQENAKTYINPIGGKMLYNRQTFFDEGIELKFLKPSFSKYEQFNGTFVSGLSIIDVMMFNSKSAVQKMLKMYTLE